MDIPDADNVGAAGSQSITLTKTTRHAVPPCNPDKRAAALLAKKKQRRAAHRVALRRSHTKG
jgi:hypothetical protein